MKPIESWQLRAMAEETNKWARKYYADAYERACMASGAIDSTCEEVNRPALPAPGTGEANE